MIPVKQTRLSDPETGVVGNCYAAAFASLLELEIAEVPAFEGSATPQAAEQAVDYWLAMIGFQRLVFWPHQTADMPRGYAIVIGRSPRHPGDAHCVIGLDGEMVHDPHPSNAGLLTWGAHEFLLPMDPAAQIRLGRELWRAEVAVATRHVGMTLVR